MRQLLTAIAALLCFAPLAAKTKKKAPAKAVPAIEIVEKVNDAWQAKHSPEVRAFWDDAVYFTGNMEAYRLTGKAAYLEFSDKWARHNKWQGATEPDHAKWQYKKYGEDPQHALFGDWQICFQTYLDMHAMNPDAYKIARTLEVMGYEAQMKESDLWWWADALYMVMPVFAKLYKQTLDESWLDAMCRFYEYADNLMYDKETSLFYRDGKYLYPAHKTDTGKKDFWARGDGWVLAALAKVLGDMPQGYKHYDFLKGRFQSIAKAVAACQQKDGYWTRSMLDPDQAAGPESSGTSLFCFGLQWGINHGILDAAAYQPVADRAWHYLSTFALQADGSVGYMQPIGEKAIKGQQLQAASVTNFGTGVFLLAACERARYESAGSTATVNISIANPSPYARQEVVEINAAAIFQKLGIAGGRQIVVRNALGNEVSYQLTHDGKLLIEASVRPLATAKFTIAKGQPKDYYNTCYGRMYPERVDDIAWENDRGAYRCYGPALQRTGEDAYGNDVWVKNTPDLVVEDRYWHEDVCKPLVAKLAKTDKAAADSVTAANSYHIDHGHGLDCYKVGPTLGCGTPALIVDGKIVFPYCWKEYKLLDNGPLRFAVELTYNTTAIAGDSVTEHRILSLDKGSNFNHMQVWWDGLTKPTDVAAGVVVHTEDTKSVVLGRDYVQYADPTDNPEGQNFQIYVAALFPDGVSATRKIMLDQPTRGNAGHALGIRRGYNSGERFSYYFGSAWSKYDCRTQSEWQLRVETALAAYRQPMAVTME